MTTIYLAHIGSGGAGPGSLRGWDWEKRPLGCLVSFYYLRAVTRDKSWPWPGVTTMLDSGAYSAAKSGKTIDRDALATEAKSGRWRDVVALDVIGDWRQSLDNWRHMRAAGVDALPTFHFGEPWGLLDEYREARKICLGGLVGRPRTEQARWIGQCFARLWPKRLHAFGITSRSILERFPFDSGDASSWDSGPSCFGNWGPFGRLSVGRARLREFDADLTAQLTHFWRLQQDLASRWGRELSKCT